jgi:hypothetical protein
MSLSTANAEIFQIYLICVNVLSDLQCQILNKQMPNA